MSRFYAQFSRRAFRVALELLVLLVPIGVVLAALPALLMYIG